MAARPTWEGHLKLSLVSCPIVLYPTTTSSERTAFRQINLKTRNRLRQQIIDDETKKVADAANKGRGLEIAKNIYLPVTDEEIDSVAIESSHTVSIERFVQHDTIDDATTTRLITWLLTRMATRRRSPSSVNLCAARALSHSDALFLTSGNGW